MILDTGDRKTPAIEVEIGCSETELRMAIARIKWRRAQSPGSQRLDVTVYKDGFKRGWYATLSTDRAGAPELTAELKEMAAADTGGRRIRPFQLTVDPKPPGIAVPDDMQVIEVRNLEPGVIYRWRLLERTAEGWMPSETATVQAPVCIADMVEER